MTKYFLRIFLFEVFLLLVTVAGVHGQTADKIDMISKWDRLASRADQVVERSQASNDTLKIILSDLLKQRKEVYSEQVLSSTKISELSEELSALGVKPAEEILEDSNISVRRKNLNVMLQAVNVPFLASSAMLKRTDFLISEVNNILRTRLTNRLFSFGATPLDINLWGPALTNFAGFFKRILHETQEILRSETQRKVFIQKLPIISILIISGLLFFLAFSKNLYVEIFVRLKNLQTVKPTPLVQMCLRILSFVSLAIATFLIIQGFKLSGLFGLNGITFLNALPLFFVILIFSKLLSESLFGDVVGHVALITLDTKKKIRASRYVALLGVVLALNTFIHGLGEIEAWGIETQAVLYFPLIGFAGFFLFKLANLLNFTELDRLTKTKGKADQNEIPVSAPIRNLVKVISVLAPILAATGYVYAAQKLIYPTVLTLSLLSVTFLVFGYFNDIFFTNPDSSSENLDDSVRSRWALLPVLLAGLLILVNIPLIGLIWGAEGSDIFAVWLKLNEGIPLGAARITLPGLISLIVIFSIGVALTRLIQRLLRMSVLPKTSLDSGGQNALISGVGYSGIILSTMIAVSSTGLDLSSLAIVAGALSVGLGFGLQTIVSNFVSGVILLIERPIKEGDWIEVAGFSGTVRKISVRSTQIQTFDRGTVIVPNSELISGSVLNYTHSNSMGRVRVPIGVAYGTDPRKVESILLSIAEKHPQVLKEPGPSVVFIGFGADSIDFEIRAFMKDVGYVLAIKSDMNYEIAKEFKKENIEIPFAQRDINIKNIDELKSSIISSSSES